MTILITVVSLTLLISAACSLFEAVLFSTRMGALEAEKVNRGLIASRFIEMKENIGVPISAILILNTIANTAGATISGMLAIKVLGVSLVPIFSVGLTLGILFFSEIIPKTIGAIYWRNLWHWIVWPLTAMKAILYPAIYITQKVTNLITRGKKTFTITEAEILAMVKLGAKEGELTDQEYNMVRNIINLEDKRVKEIMTPRTMMVALPENSTIQEAINQLDERGVSRVPIYGENIDHITGYVTLQEITSRKMIEKQKTELKKIVNQIHFFPEAINCLSLLTRFLKARIQIAMITDEHGGVAGLVTLEDLIETALGTEIVDETDRYVDLQKSARDRNINRM